MSKPGYTYYCTKCGGKKVEVHMYVNVNTLEVENDPEWDRKTPCWCLDCNDNSNITEDPDEWKEYMQDQADDEKFEVHRDKDNI